MSVISTIINCPDLQSDLNEHFVNTNTAAYMETPGFLNFLLSETNRAGVSQVQDFVSPGGGKLRTVQLRYEQRLLETDVAETFSLDCTPTLKIGDTIASYDIDPDAEGLKVSTIISYADLRNNCKDNNDWFNIKMMQLLGAMDRKVAQKMADQAALKIGAFADPTDVTANVKTVKTQDSSGNNLQNLLEEVVYNSENNGFPGPIVSFGWGETKKYMTRVNAACCATSGTNINEFMMQNPFSFVGDYRIEQVSAFGPNNFLVTTPGALQVILYNEFKGFNEVMDASFTNTTLYSPMTGIPYDLAVQKICSNGGIHIAINLRVAAKLVSMPSDMFAVGDRLEGVNFVNQYEINNA